MKNQTEMFDDTPVPIHASPHDTEVEAAERVQSVVGTLRRSVLDLVAASGTQGVTPWEAIVALGYQGSEYSIRPRFSELSSEKFSRVIYSTSQRRRNGRGNNELVFVASKHEPRESTND